MTVSVKFSPWGNQQFVDESGNPAVGWYIETYAAGSANRQATYTDATGTTAQTADIVLNALGLPTSGQIWLIAGSAYKFKLYNATGVLKDTADNISGVNDSSETTDQWVSSGLTPTYINATTFTLVGDQTTDFHVGRRLQFTVTAGTVYGTIATSVYATLTTVTVSLDSGSLDSGLSAINLSILRADTSALPKTAYNVTSLNATGPINEARATVVGNATTSDIWGAASANSINLTGVITYTNFPAAPQAGAKRRLYPATGAVFTNAGAFGIVGNANYTVPAGSSVDVEAITTTTFRLVPLNADGTPLVVVPIAQGGTGANTAALARTALGIGKTIGQIVTSVSGAVATGTTLIPFDDTIPQITEGDQYMSLAITPQNASSTLVIDVVIALIVSSVANNMSAALFQDSTANALAAVEAGTPSASGTANLRLQHIMTAGTTSATTFKLRAGGSVAGTTTFNGFSSGRVFGGVAASRITITEILP